MILLTVFIAEIFLLYSLGVSPRSQWARVSAGLQVVWTALLWSKREHVHHFSGIATVTLTFTAYLGVVELMLQANSAKRTRKLATAAVPPSPNEGPGSSTSCHKRKWDEFDMAQMIPCDETVQEEFNAPEAEANPEPLSPLQILIPHTTTVLREEDAGYKKPSQTPQAFLRPSLTIEEATTRTTESFLARRITSEEVRDFIQAHAPTMDQLVARFKTRAKRLRQKKTLLDAATNNVRVSGGRIYLRD